MLFSSVEMVKVMVYKKFYTVPVINLSIYIRQVNDYPISFVSFVFHCKFNNQHNRKTMGHSM